jgi:photosystem II stability/assembly factor-like uncharacterized protein
MFKNSYLVGIIFVVLHLSCKQKEKEIQSYEPRIIKKVQLQKFDHKKFGLQKMNSIRAIDLVDGNAYFAAEGGLIYAFFKNGNFLITPNTFFGNDVPDFRAISHSGNKLYVLSIASPAKLYQIEIDKKEGLTNPKLVYTEQGEKVFYDAINFFDDKNGIAMGDPTEDCLSILLTNDGGENWNKVSCDSLPKTIDGEAAFAASNTNIAIVGNNAWIISGGMQSRVFHTKDKGTTWEVVQTPLLYGEPSTGGYSIAFADKLNGIICGGDYTNKTLNLKNKAITNDGGKTWKLVADGQIPSYISCVQYVPKTQGKEVFAVSTEGIYFSNDKGNSWVKVSNEGYYTIKFVDKNMAWLAGNGKIAKMILK